MLFNVITVVIETTMDLRDIDCRQHGRFHPHRLYRHRHQLHHRYQHYHHHLRCVIRHGLDVDLANVEVVNIIVKRKRLSPQIINFYVYRLCHSLH